MSLSSLLPQPKHSSKWSASSDDEDEDGSSSNALTITQTKSKGKQQKQQESSVALRKLGPPPYGKRKGFIPRQLTDYGDGGAFPEIHVAQYPLNMGRAGGPLNVAETLPLQTDESGRIRYDMVLKQGQNKNDKKIIHSSLKDMTAQDVLEDDPSLARPSKEEIEETRKKTQEAFDKILGKKVGYAKAKNDEERKSGPTYVRYTPANNSGDQNVTGAKSRIIAMSEAPVDPMEPPRFKHKKLPRGPGSPPPPVLHSPTRKLTVEEQKEWVIPPCISNWKNAKGYTIPLDKRLANDGRGLQEVTINDNFAKLSEALFIADRHAREEVRLRSEMQAKVAAKEKKEKEEKLRMLAQKAREERAGLISGSRATTAFDTTDQESAAEDGYRPSNRPSAADMISEEEDNEELTESERQALKEREALRRDKAKQREREMRLSHMGSETKARVMSKLEDRDISEKIALGLAQPTLSKESMFDQRLFNQSAGLSSGFSAEDSYSLYDKPLFAGSSSSMIYQPRTNRGGPGDDSGVAGVQTEKIEKLLGDRAPHKGFQGAEATKGGDARSGPVQFEKEVDPFGLQEFMASAKRGRDASESSADSTSKRTRGD